MSDGVRFEGVHDALIVAVNTSLIRLKQNVHYDGGKCRCGGNTHTQTGDQQMHEMVETTDHIRRSGAFRRNQTNALISVSDI